MKKKLLLAILIFSIYNNIQGQTIIVNYSEKRIVSKEREESLKQIGAYEETVKPKFYYLKYSNGKSFYANTDENKNIETSKITEEESENAGSKEIKTTTTQLNFKNIEKWYYKDFQANIMFFKFNNVNKEWNGKDNLVKWDWEISDETQIVNGYLCKKAISKFGGMNFICWYTDEIAVNSGPEKFDGLPGLILYVHTPHYEWRAESIKFEPNSVKIEEPIMPDETHTLAEVYSLSSKYIQGIKPATEVQSEGNKTTTKSTFILKN